MAMTRFSGMSMLLLDERFDRESLIGLSGYYIRQAPTLSRSVVGLWVTNVSRKRLNSRVLLGSLPNLRILGSKSRGKKDLGSVLN
jgi:hypothetical protein